MGPLCRSATTWKGLASDLAKFKQLLEGRRPAIPATIRRLGGAGGQFDEPGGELGGLGVAERGERAPGVEVDGGAGGGVDPLAAASAGLDRLGEDLACLVEYGRQEKWPKAELQFLKTFLADFGIGEESEA